MSETLIKVENVSKKFCRSLKKSLWYGVQDLGREITGRQHGGDGELRPDEFWAVKDVSFELKRGECLGLIGRNGAGKTTLLKMLNGLIKPDYGRIELRGRVGALIALGAGFNPILTGQENIYVNGAVLGLLKHEIDERIEEIIEFSELKEFINMPVQSYSSGMQVRLGFAIASSLNPDILLLDEVLAVGDTAFRMKCFARMKQVIGRGIAGILVSHNAVDIDRICNRGIFLERGRLAEYGTKEDAMYSYQQAINETQNYNQPQNPQPNNQTKISLSLAKPSIRPVFKTGESIDFVCNIAAGININKARLIFHLSSNLGMLASTSSLLTISTIDIIDSEIQVKVTMKETPLLQGAYSIWLDLYGENISDYISSSNMLSLLIETPFFESFGYGAYHTFLPDLVWST